MNVVVDHYSVYYKIAGQGDKTAVILQGWGAPCGAYDSVAAMILDGYRVVQLDFPGFGRSDEPDEPWGVDNYVDFLLAFLLEIGVESATFIAHSYGGRVLIKMAARQDIPVTIERIVLVDSAGLVRERTRSENMRIAWFKAMKRVANVGLIRNSFPDLIEDWMSRQGSEDYRNSSPVMKATMVKSISEDLGACLPNVRPETLLIWGADDDATPLKDGERMEREMPNASLVSIPNAGHFPFVDNPDLFRAIIRAYLVDGE